MSISRGTVKITRLPVYIGFSTVSLLPRYTGIHHENSWGGGAVKPYQTITHLARKYTLKLLIPVIWYNILIINDGVGEMLVLAHEVYSPITLL